MGTIIAMYSVPYDMDDLWDEGCRGSDLWGDSYGERVNVLVSDRGSAYACPEDPRNRWRVYVDPCGRAVRVPRVMWEGGAIVKHPGDWPRFGDVLSCGLESGVIPAKAIAAIAGEAGCSRPNYPSSLDGMRIQIGAAWSSSVLSFGDSGVELKVGADDIFYVATDGVPWHWSQWEDCDSEGCWKDDSTDFMRSRDLDYVIRTLGKEFDAEVDPGERHLVEIALRIFEGARRMMSEVAMYEAVCWQGYDVEK